MKILHINTYDRGGAAKACIRLHLSMLAQGIDSHLLLFQRFENQEIPNSVVYNKVTKNKKSFLNRVFTRLFAPLKVNKNETIKKSIRALIPETVDWFSFPDTGIDITSHPLYQEADIINLHWISDFLDYSFFEKNNKPLVWTFHDMNSFTGGCHYTFGCNGFQGNCMDCPQLQTIPEKNFSSLILNYKEKYLLKDENLTIVCPSIWLKDQTQKSKIFNNKKAFTIPYGLDSEVFQPRDKTFSRKVLGLPLDKKIILFVSSYLIKNKRKGYDYLERSLYLLNEFSDETVLCVVGGKSNQIKNTFKVYENSSVSDERLMSMFYSACDLYVIPSLEDNLPNTVLESLLCGTPVIGFNTSGIPDMVIDGKNGYLAKEINADSLAKTIRKFLSEPDIFERNKIRENALEKYDSSIQRNSYLSLYKNMV